MEDKFNYIYNSQMFYFVMGQLYTGAPDSLKTFSFDEIMQNNMNRSNFLIALFESNELSNIELEQLDSMKDFLVNFIIGNNNSLKIDKKFLSDKDNNCVFLLRSEWRKYTNFLKIINNKFKNFENKHIALYDENDSLVQEFSVQKKDLTNILGLSDIQIKDTKQIDKSWKKFKVSGLVDDFIDYVKCKDGKKPNLLFKHFFHKKAKDSYEDFYEYITSQDGINDLNFLYEVLNDFIKEDIKVNPDRYIGNNVSSKRKVDFQDDYYKYIKNEYYYNYPMSSSLKELIKREYPLLKGSKYYALLYNFLNFLNMNHLFTFASEKINNINENEVVEQFNKLYNQFAMFFENENGLNDIKVLFDQIINYKDYYACGEMFEKFKDLISNKLLKINDEETKKLADSFVSKLELYVNNHDAYIDKKYLINNNYGDNEDKLNVMVTKDGSLINSMIMSKEDYDNKDVEFTFIDKIEMDGQIIRISSLSDEINYYNYFQLNSNKLKELNEQKLLLSEVLEKFSAKEKIDNKALEEKYIKIVLLIEQAINSLEIQVFNNVFEIYKNNKLLTKINEENMKLLGIVENIYLNRSIINNYLEKNSLMSK